MPGDPGATQHTRPLPGKAAGLSAVGSFQFRRSMRSFLRILSQSGLRGHAGLHGAPGQNHHRGSPPQWPLSWHWGLVHVAQWTHQASALGCIFSRRPEARPRPQAVTGVTTGHHAGQQVAGANRSRAQPPVIFSPAPRQNTPLRTS